MAAPFIDPERIAQIIADADLLGIATAADKHGISTRTILRYRKRVQGDSQLSAAVTVKKEPVLRAWLEETGDAKRRALHRVLDLLDTSEDLHDVAGAFKIISDSDIAAQVLVNGLDQSHEQVPSAPETTPAETHVALEHLIAEQERKQRERLTQS